jgi:ribosome maturation factor RimP
LSDTGSVTKPNAQAQALPAGHAARPGFRASIEQTVTGLGYELVDVERAARGLLRVYIDRMPGHSYAGGDSEFVTVDDCEQVTRQLQYALEVDAVDYERLEVSSPGLDRPLRNEADFGRFAGHDVSLTLKQPFQGRKVWKGVLTRTDGAGWSLVFKDEKPAKTGKAKAAKVKAPTADKVGAAAAPVAQLLSFTLDEVREARLVPVVDFKGRRGQQAGAETLGATGGQGR